MNWQFADALTTADRMAFFKYMVKAIAEKHGLRATFMPKPFVNLTGSGCHVHVSLWKGNKNLFEDGKDGLGLSRTAYNFIGGVMNAASELCSITNPTVNSYKRINAPVTTSGATWSPNTVTYAGNNRTHMIRIPGGGRFEFRLADGATNPYLFPAALLAAGLDGIARTIDPGKPLDIDMYAEGHKAPAGTKKLPLNLLDALRITEGSALLRRELGDEFVNSYIKLKTREWNDYARHLTAWERANTLDC
jgi:glutamine synthetase